VEVDEGYITWVDREPTPDPEEALKEAMARMEDKLDTIIKQQAALMESVAKLQKDKVQEGGSKAQKKKQPKAKDIKE
jgi:hypothetical protein